MTGLEVCVLEMVAALSTAGGVLTILDHGLRFTVHWSIYTGHWRGSAVEAVLLEDVHLLLGLESEGVDAGEPVLRPRPRQEGQTRAQAAAQEAGGHGGGLGLAAWDNTVKSSENKTL